MDSTTELDAAAALQAELRKSEAETKRIRAARDEAVRAAVAGSTQHDVGQFIGITQQAVARICARG